MQDRRALGGDPPIAVCAGSTAVRIHQFEPLGARLIAGTKPAVPESVQEGEVARDCRSAGVNADVPVNARGVHREGDLGVAVEIAAFGGAQQVLQQVPGFGGVQADQCNQGERKRRMLGEYVALSRTCLLGGDGVTDVLTSGGIVAPEHGDHGTCRRAPGVGRLGVADLVGEFRKHGQGRVESPLQDADIGHVGGMAHRVHTEPVASEDCRFRRRSEVERVTQATGKGNVDVALWQCGQHINRKRVRQEMPLVC